MSVRNLFATRLYEAELGDGLLDELAHSIRTLAEDDEAGKRWSAEHLYPGYTSYAKILHAQTYDILELLCAGTNTIDVLLSDGSTMTCSKELNSDLFWATCGGMGLTGIITRVQFDLKKIETSYIKQKQVKAKNL